MTTIQVPVPVTVAKTAAGKFIATSDVRLEAEGDTAEEAVAKLRGRAEPMSLPITPPGVNPWLAVIGMWKDTDPELIAGWRKAIEDNRNAQQEEDRAREEGETTPPDGEPPARLAPIPVSDHPNPWAALAESFKDDPAVDEWLKVMADLRDSEGPIPELMCQEPA